MIKPIGDKVLVEEIVSEKKSESGIILSSRDPRDTVYAKVLGIGKDVESVKVGDTLLIAWGKVTPVDNVTKGIIAEEEIFAVMEA